MVCSRATARRIRRSLVIFALVSVGPGASRAATTLVTNLEELIGGSDRVVLATVLSTKPAAATTGTPPAMVTKVRVEETFSGTPVKEYEFRQLGRLGPGKAVSLYPGLPRFTDGERVVLFLPKPSAQGFSSPVALGQGTFRVQGVSGDGIVTNESRNRTLFRNLKTTQMTRLTRGFQKPESTLKVSELKVLVQSFSGSVK